MDAVPLAAEEANMWDTSEFHAMDVMEAWGVLLLLLLEDESGEHG